MTCASARHKYSTQNSVVRFSLEDILKGEEITKNSGTLIFILLKDEISEFLSQKWDSISLHRKSRLMHCQLYGHNHVV